MALITKAIKGTKDVLPQDAYKIQYIEATARETAADFGYKEIRTPVFEHTELFQRGVGDTTDVVQKEMYTFDDKGGRSITLRPEGTAGAARAFLENGLCNEALPQKVYYLVSCYRYEKPQAGRLREFHQFGVECFGTQSPLADAELIALASAFFDRLGVTGLRLEINSIGCPTCRAKYYDALRSYFAARKDELCDTCQGRLERNPMRILDCKSPVCQEIAKDAPAVTDYLCDECREHFDKVQSYLKAQNIDYTVNSRIVRGLDYYTKTVFEYHRPGRQGHRQGAGAGRGYARRGLCGADGSEPALPACPNEICQQAGRPLHRGVGRQRSGYRPGAAESYGHRGGNGSSAFYLCQRILQRQYAGAAGRSGDQRRSL